MWVRQRFPMLSRRLVEEALEAGLCTKAGRTVKKGVRLAADESLDCTALVAHLVAWRRAGGPAIAIVAERQEWTVVDKPPGVKSHPLSMFDAATITQWALER